MQSTTSSSLTQQISKQLCYYFNSTNRIQLIRMWNGKSYSWSTIIFAHQRILFEAKPEEILEVRTKQEGEILKSIFVCSNLQVKDRLQLASV